MFINLWVLVVKCWTVDLGVLATASTQRVFTPVLSAATTPYRDHMGVAYCTVLSILYSMKSHSHSGFLGWSHDHIITPVIALCAVPILATGTLPSPSTLLPKGYNPLEVILTC